MSRPTGNLFGWALALLGITLFASLGLWQLERARQKETMLAEASAILSARVPLALSAASDPIRRTSYDWAQGSGHFTSAPAVLLDNQGHQGRPGIRVLRVFQPEGDSTPLLVDLGWLPLPGDRRLPAIERWPDAQSVAGLLAPPPSAGIASAVAVPQADGNLLVTSLDHALLIDALKLPALAPRLLRLDPAMGIGYARDLQILPNTLPPERHLGYAVQWFGLAVAVFITALVLTLRTRRRRQHAAREKMAP